MLSPTVAVEGAVAVAVVEAEVVTEELGAILPPKAARSILVSFAVCGAGTVAVTGNVTVSRTVTFEDAADAIPRVLLSGLGCQWPMAVGVEVGVESSEVRLAQARNASSERIGMQTICTPRDTETAQNAGKLADCSRNEGEEGRN